jgi:uncharacterized circularly permuted ATP-grasp superfamily protein
MLRAFIRPYTRGAGRVKYEPGDSFFDEMYTADGRVRPHYQGLEQYIDLLGVPEFQRRHGMLDLAFRNQGITLPFTVTPRAPSGPFPSIRCRASFRPPNGRTSRRG